MIMTFVFSFCWFVEKKKGFIFCSFFVSLCWLILVLPWPVDKWCSLFDAIKITFFIKAIMEAGDDDVGCCCCLPIGKWPTYQAACLFSGNESDFGNKDSLTNVVTYQLCALYNLYSIDFFLETIPSRTHIVSLWHCLSETNGTQSNLMNIVLSLSHLMIIV